jgi:outer membrane lipoprotein-sorting protein
MKTPRIYTWFLAFLLLPTLTPAQETNTPLQVFSGALARLVAIVQPTNDSPPTLTAKIKVLRADGLPQDLLNQEMELSYQAPDHLRFAAQIDRQRLTVCRNGQEVWIHAPAKHFGLLGSPDVPRFASAPDRKDTPPLGPIKLPLPSEQLMLLPLLMDLEALPDEPVGGAKCRVIKVTPKPEAIRAFKLPRATYQIWVRETDSLLLRLAYRDAGGQEIQVQFVNPEFNTAFPAARWQLQPGQDDQVQKVARSHVTRFLSVAVGMLSDKVPPLGPPTGERRVLAREGQGRLELIDGTRVLVLKGTPEEMGRQHGKLMKKEIKDLVDHILYGVGVGSSFAKGRWFFAEIESAQKRLNPFINERYYREMDALADAAGLDREEVRLANFFPELFHCSGFAVFGKATLEGRLYHGRVLDYLRGMGLEQNAVVMVLQPDQGHAWVNVSYAGFIGSVTAMNEKHLAIGEMGGRGEGNWDGKPMAQLLREVMEKAGTLDEGLALLRQGPRTCEYYYVLSDGNSRRAVGIAATPDKFETVWPGQSHPLLPHAIADAVLLSASERYEELARRVQAGYGQLDAAGARGLMRRPVAMKSNIHCALFAPETLDFWVANADSQNVAAHARFTQYNLRQLLQPENNP